MINNIPLTHIRHYCTPLFPQSTKGEALLEIKKSPSKKKIKAVFFDIYGTLLISESGDIGENKKGDHRPLSDLLENYGIKKSEKIIRQSLNKQIHLTHKALQKRGIIYPEINIKQIWNQVPGVKHLSPEKLELFSIDYECYTNHCYPMGNLLTLFNTLSLKKIPFGLISNAQFYTPLLFKAFYNKSLEELGFQRDLLFFSYQFHEAKPSLILFQKAEKAIYPISPENCLYIGNDALKDILPAEQMGFQTALFAGDKRSLKVRQNIKECSLLQCDYIFFSIKDIIDFIKDLSP